jgi:predicted  nucleic acid-binding Zn-ribbon protein
MIDVLSCSHMRKETDLERLSRLVLKEFKGVHAEFDRVHGRFDAIDARFDALESRVSNIETELREIRKRLEALEEAAKSTAGFAKEIDHLLARVTKIEKHLGIHQNIAA